jgi:hypothetical protein
MSSGPPSPVALVGSHFPSTDEPPELDLDSDETEPGPELDGVGDLVEVLQVEGHDDDETEDDEDIRMHGTGAPPPPVMVVDDEEEEEEGDTEDEEMLSPHLRQGRVHSTPPSEADSIEIESARMGSSPPPARDSDDDDDDAYMNGVNGVNGFYEEDEDDDAGATETDREASIPPLSKTPAPLRTPEHEICESRARASSPAAAVYTPPPALVLTPSPPPEEQERKPRVVDMPTKSKSKKRPAAPKKKGQAASRKRASMHDDFDDDDDSVAGGASPKKKSKKSGSSTSKTKKKTATSSAFDDDEDDDGDDKTNIIGLPKFDENGEQLYCICRKPDTGKWMIACDGCEDWYHGECVNVKEADGDLIDKYYCGHPVPSTRKQTN